MQVPAYVISRHPAAYRGHYAKTRRTISARPAGQAQLSTTPIGVTNGQEPGNPAPGLNIFGWDDQGRPLDAQGTPLPSSVPQGGPIGGAPSASDQALFNTVGGALNTTGATIASIVQSNNQVQIAQLQTQTQQQIAALQSSATQAQQQGNFALAQQNAQAAANLQRFNAYLLTRQQQPNIALYVVAGLAGLVIIGGIVYAVSASKSRSNPVKRFASYVRRMAA